MMTVSLFRLEFCEMEKWFTFDSLLKVSDKLRHQGPADKTLWKFAINDHTSGRYYRPATAFAHTMCSESPRQWCLSPIWSSTQKFCIAFFTLGCIVGVKYCQYDAFSKTHFKTFQYITPWVICLALEKRNANVDRGSKTTKTMIAGWCFRSNQV